MLTVKTSVHIMPAGPAVCGIAQNGTESCIFRAHESAPIRQEDDWEFDFDTLDAPGLPPNPAPKPTVPEIEIDLINGLESIPVIAAQIIRALQLNQISPRKATLLLKGLKAAEEGYRLAAADEFQRRGADLPGKPRAASSRRKQKKPGINKLR